jgi:DnaK suppressor protein
MRLALDQWSALERTMSAKRAKMPKTSTTKKKAVTTARPPASRKSADGPKKPASAAMKTKKKAAAAATPAVRGSGSRPGAKTEKKAASVAPVAARRGSSGDAGKARSAAPRQTLDLDHFRQRLREKQKELFQSYANAKGDSRSREADGTEDYIDYAVSSYDREFLLSLTEMEKNQLRLVEEALERIERGEYGRCSQCDLPIPSKRLEVQPWARHCVQCQELEEQGLMRESFERLPDEDQLESSLGRSLEEGGAFVEEKEEEEEEVDDEEDEDPDDDDLEPDDEDTHDGGRMIGG